MKIYLRKCLAYYNFLIDTLPLKYCAFFLVMFITYFLNNLTIQTLKNDPDGENNQNLAL
jgi:hypothetical protein